MTKRTRLLLITLLSCALLVAGVLAIGVSADAPTDAMVDIEAELAEYLITAPTRVENDGYIGIPIEYSVYYDKANGKAVPDFIANGGTPVVMYIVNTMAERVGTETDTAIIRSMLDRGYVVFIMDYLNQPKASGNDLDWSVQNFRRSVVTGGYVSGTEYIPKGNYKENFVAPAGCNVSLNHVFWEADRHGAEGTVDKIVETWNNDFRGTNADVVIKWVDENGVRKSTAKGIDDGSEPVWYTDAAGTAVDTSGTGEYIRVRHTWANDIFDCTEKDGRPIDLNLYMHIVYPTGTDEALPVTALANSSTFPTTQKTSADYRPHSVGFTFRGYVNVVFDYLWVPMAREASYGYFDGGTSDGRITGDQMTYSLHIYNDKKINTAAMRYLRHLANENEEFNFDTESIGVYGNSKGGWFTFLGTEELHTPTEVLPGYTLEESIDARFTAYTSKRQFPGHADETRYQAGNRATVSEGSWVLDGGELQPWLTYETGELAGKEIPSYATVLYACCGPAYEDMDIGLAPIFITSNLQDNYNSAYNSSNIRANLARVLNVPSLVCEADVGHMLTHGPEYTYGFDTYDAFMDFFGYYLNGGSLKVVYTVPGAGGDGISVSDSVTVKFIGSVAESEIARATLTDADGATVRGEWSSLYGDTEWTFTPTEALAYGSTYTLTLPADLKGDNGTSLGEAYTASFRTEAGILTEATASGLLISTKVPEAAATGYKLRFFVSNNAANVVSVIALDSPTDTSGATVATVNLSGRGYYTADVTDHLAARSAGDDVYFLISPEREAAVSEIFREEFESVNASGKTPLGTTFGAYVRGADSVYGKGEKLEATTAPDGSSAVKFIIGMNGTRYPNIEEYPVDNEFYARTTIGVFNTGIFGSSPLSEDDYGRTFEITMRIYDTTERRIYAYLESMSGIYLDHAYHGMDYSQVTDNFTTVKDGWCELTLYYTVYDSDFGPASLYQAKELYYEFSPEGYMENGKRVDYPMYVDYISVKETVTDVELGGAALVATLDGKAVKAPEGEGVALISGGTVKSTYATLSAALAAAGNGDTVKLLSNYTITDSESTAYLAALESITLDLGGYRLTSLARNTSPVHISASTASNTVTAINVTNGSIYTKYTPVITFGGTSAAGAGREFEVSFTDVYFGAIGTTFTLEIMAESSAAAALECSVSLEGCELEYRDRDLARLEALLFPTGVKNLDITYTVTGGSISLDSSRWLALTDTIKTLTLDGTRLVLPASATPDEGGIMTESGVASFTEAASDGYRVEYTTAVSPLSTRYGMIPEQYADTELYPFVVFDEDGNFFGTYGSFDLLMDCFLNRRDGREWFTVMRRDVVHNVKVDNLSMGVGTYYIDLLGNTITCDGVMLFNADAKTNGDVAVHVQNGGVEVDSLGMIRLLGWATSKYDTSVIKHFDFHFENVDISLADGAATTDLVTYYHERGASSAGPAYNDLSFTDCTFDVRGAAADITLFNVGAKNGGAYLVADLDVFGCEIIADSTEGVTVYKLNTESGSSAAFAESEGGYLKYTVPASAPVPTVTLPDARGKSLLFAPVGEEGGSITYQLTEDNLNTPYGKIPEEFASREDYPFAVFAKGGTFVTATADFTVTAAKAASEAGDGAVILMRRDADIKACKAGSNSFNFEGKVTVDLGGYTLSMSDSGADAFIRLQPTVLGRSSTVEVKGGRILMGSDPVVRFAAVSGSLTDEYKAGAAENPHKLTAIFTGITFEMDPTASSYKYLILYSYGNTDLTDDNTLILDSCTVNTADFVPEYGILASHITVGVKVHVIGGELRCALTDLSKFKLDALNTQGGSAIDFARDSDGRMLTLRTLTGATGIPTKAYTDATLGTDPSLTFTEFATDSVYTTYMLSTPTLETPYGTIPPEYASEKDYPFAVFKKDGTFVGCYDSWGVSTSPQGGALHYAKNAGDGAVVYLRCDHTYSIRQYDNLGQQKGTLYIDLGGNTLTDASTHDYALFYSTKKVAYDTTVVVKNGTIELTKNPLARLYANTNAGDGVQFNLIFEGINITCSADSSVTSVIVSDISTAATKATTTNFTFNDCTFDLTNAKSGVKLANLALTKYIGTVNVQINGGSIILGDKAVTFIAPKDGSSATFGKGKSGYTTFSYPEGTAAATDAFPTAGGSYYLTLRTTEGGRSVYNLMPAELRSFGIKTNVVLYSDFVFNLFVPVRDSINEIVLGGKAVDISTLECREIDGESYYVIPVALHSYAAARTISLKVSVKHGEDVFGGSWTPDIISYAEAVLGNADTTIEEDQLMRDMLAYVRAAYVYFAECGKVQADELEAVNERIGAIIGEHNSATVPEDKTTLGTPALKGATVQVGACVAFVFYPTSDPESYTFRIGNRVLDATVVEGDEPYIIVTTYAYAITDVITYTCEASGERGEYCLGSYYAYQAANGGSDALLQLLRALTAYGSSAAAYRNEVLVNEK